MAGGLELGDPQGPFQPKPVYDSMIHIPFLINKDFILLFIEKNKEK